MTVRYSAIAFLLLFACFAACADNTGAGQDTPPPAATVIHSHPYKWNETYSPDNSLEKLIQPPDGYERVLAEEGSFASWLRGLPLLPGRPDVLLYNGRRKWNQRAQYAVVDIDVGDRDLQQCADAVMRLRAEYLYASGRRDDIAFNFTSGDRAAYSEWSKGMRPVVNGNKVAWKKLADEDGSRESFRAYLDKVFEYAGSYSLSRELVPVAELSDIRPGNVFIQGGFPGHAVIVADVAVDVNGDKAFILIQSYMPAQQMHVLVNPDDSSISPWYSIRFGPELITPEWTFGCGDLKRFM